MIARAHIAQLTDSQLMKAIKNGDMEPLGEVFKRYGGPVRSLIWRLLPDESSSEAEDICHEVFMTVYQIAERFDASCELRPWLFGIAVRKARSWRRKKWLRQKILRARTQEGVVFSTQEITATDDLISFRRELDTAIRTLPAAQREVLILYVANKMSGEQIAQLLGVPLNTVWTRLRRARIAMRKALKEEFSQNSEIGGE